MRRRPLRHVTFALGAAITLLLVLTERPWMFTILFCVLTFGGWRYHVALEPLMLLVVAPVVCAVWALRRDIEKAVAGPVAPAIQGGNESC